MLRIPKSPKPNGTNGKGASVNAPEVTAFFDAALAILNRVAASAPAPVVKETIPA